MYQLDAKCRSVVYLWSVCCCCLVVVCRVVVVGDDMHGCLVVWPSGFGCKCACTVCAKHESPMKRLPLAASGNNYYYYFMPSHVRACVYVCECLAGN